MMGKVSGLLVWICLVSWIPLECEACKCAVQHPQKLICSNGFVMVAKILSKEAIGNNQDEYTVKVIIPLKNSPGHGKLFKFTTADDGAACGVFYTIGSTELLTGTNNQIDSCNSYFGKTLPQLSYIFSKEKTASYLKNCGCKIIQPMVALGGKICLEPTDDTVRACYNSQGVCVQVGSGRCEWRNIDGC